MLLTPGNSFNYYVSSAASVSAWQGVSVTANATPNTEGAWTQLVSATSDDIYWFSVTVSRGAVSAAYRSYWLDIGVDNAGGTSYTSLISDLVVSSNTLTTSINGLRFFFPLFIKSGSTVAARVQSNVASANIRCLFQAYGKPSAPHLVRVGTFTESIGLGTAPAATAFTPGDSAAEGAWASLGTTTNDLFWFQLGVQSTDTTLTSNIYHFDLAYGDGTNFVMLIENLTCGTSTSETIEHYVSADAPQQKYVPAGSTLYVRGSCTGTSDTGWQAACVGVG